MRSERQKARQRELEALRETREGIAELERLYAEKCVPSKGSLKRSDLRTGYLIRKIVEAEFPDG